MEELKKRIVALIEEVQKQTKEGTFRSLIAMGKDFDKVQLAFGSGYFDCDKVMVSIHGEDGRMLTHDVMETCEAVDKFLSQYTYTI
jgi:hypothetical protein